MHALNEQTNIDIEIDNVTHFFEKKVVSVLLVYSEAKLLTSDQIESFLAPHFQNQSIEQ